ncbi:MAG TPA: GntG family PLP-dependent aldolase, partial [Gaiellaceae bacterium]
TAELLGMEDALFFPSGTQANGPGIALCTRPGTELVLEANAHLVTYELAGVAALWGVQIRPVETPDGRLTAPLVRRALRPASPHLPRVAAVAVENTHNAAGGVVWPLDALDAAVATARELGVPVHLDGARVLNAAVALGVEASRIAAQFDTVTLCLSKGLGAPLGALIAGSAGLMARARREKHAFGGAMRQAGIVAAGGLYALDHNVERLAEDHDRARRLAEAWAAAGLPVRGETNFVQIDVAALGLSPQEAIERIAAEGVRLSGAGPGRLRAVTHLDLSDADVDRACELVPRALGIREPVDA